MIMNHPSWVEAFITAQLFVPSAVTFESTQHAFLVGPIVKVFQPIYVPHKHNQSSKKRSESGSRVQSSTDRIKQRCGILFQTSTVLSVRLMVRDMHAK
jgi:hypothetical protein